ncbi:hypothetical protein [Hoeflea sp. TYP-13]|uniref:hypothetical protein n=1 Tax=Hoeflea sp. TYP-13 TaxID=3230023 RepID=UPI0034C68C41
MSEQKMMGRAIFSSFIAAGAVIVAAALFLAPQAGMSRDAGCNAAYGIDECSIKPLKAE